MVLAVGVGAPQAGKINTSVAKTVKATRENIMMVRGIYIRAKGSRGVLGVRDETEGGDDEGLQ